jgi:hypothetical protein
MNANVLQKLVVGCLIFFMSHGVALAGVSETEKYWRGQFSGYGSIVFQCVYDDSVNLKEICDLVVDEAKFRAAVASVDLWVAAPNEATFRFITIGREKQSNPITLQLTLRATNPKLSGDAQAIYAKIAFMENFDAAVEQSSASGERIHPIAGDIEIFMLNLTASGPRNELITPVVNALKGNLTRSFTHFLKYR